MVPLGILHLLQQAEDILNAQQDLANSRESLTHEKVSILDAIQDQENERDALNKDRDTRAELLSEIKREEKRLRKKLKVQEKEHKRLSQEIMRIIELIFSRPYIFIPVKIYLDINFSSI